MGLRTYLDCSKPRTIRRIRFRTLTASSSLHCSNFLAQLLLLLWHNVLHKRWDPRPLPRVYGHFRNQCWYDDSRHLGCRAFGRLPLLPFGGIDTTVCAIVSSTTSQGNQSSQSVEVALPCLYIAFFTATWGFVPWVVVGEIFPLKVRTKAMSLSTASVWLSNLGIAYTSESLLFVGERS